MMNWEISVTENQMEEKVNLRTSDLIPEVAQEYVWYWYTHLETWCIDVCRVSQEYIK